MYFDSLCSGFSIEGPSQAKIECDDKGDGSCDVHYWPTEPGDYAVHVICDDEDIKDSPFMAHILPAANDVFPEKVIPTYWIINYAYTILCTKYLRNVCLLRLQVKAYGPGLKPSGIIVNKPTEFTVDARLAGKGHLKIYAQVWRAPVCETFIVYLWEHIIYIAYWLYTPELTCFFIH